MFGSSAMVSGILLLGICEIWNMALISVTGQEAVLAISNQLAAIILATGFALYLLALLAYDVLISFDNLRAAERREAASACLPVMQNYSFYVHKLILTFYSTASTPSVH
jgi:hypothetical protein